MKQCILTYGVLAVLLATAGCATVPMGSQRGNKEFSCGCEGIENQNCGNRNCRNGNCKRSDEFSSAAVPIEPGYYVNGWNNAMQCSARAEQFVVPRNVWFAGGSQLGPEASDNIIQLASKLNAGNDHLVLEKEPVQPHYSETLDSATARTKKLNTQRRSAFVAALQNAGVADADARVHLSPIAELGTRGIEAPQVFNSLFIGGNRGGGQNGGGGQGQGGIGGGGGLGGGGGRGF